MERIFRRGRGLADLGPVGVSPARPRAVDAGIGRLDDFLGQRGLGVQRLGLVVGRCQARASPFFGAFLMEKALSMDNIFVFVVIFRFFHIPRMFQYRVLFWGILGAVVMRLAFILAGVELIERFSWVIPVFGVFLIYTAYKLIRHSGAEVHPENNIVLKMARRLLPVAHGDHRQHGHSFFVRENGLLRITPMFLVLLVIESTDVIFAVDSVPAVIGIIRQQIDYPPSAIAFLAFTSNVFAILGLRALYFLLGGMVEAFRYLHYGLAAVLGFVGMKMLTEHWLEDQGIEPLSPGVSVVDYRRADRHFDPGIGHREKRAGKTRIEG